MLKACLIAGLMKEHGSAVGSVAVLSSYKAQVTALRSHFERVHNKAKLAAVEFATIDGFQVVQPLSTMVFRSSIPANHSARTEPAVGFQFTLGVMSVAGT